MSVYFVTIVSCILVGVTYGAQSPDCTDSRRQSAYMCAEKLFFAGNNSRLLPETEAQLQAHCSESNELMKCVKDFTDKCRHGLHKSIATIMISTVRFNTRNYCFRPQKRAELLSMASCGNAIRTESTACMDPFLWSLGRANHAVKRYRVPHGCCAYYELKTCILKSGETYGKGMCSHRQLDYFGRYMQGMAGNTLNFMCGDYDEDSDRCARLPPLPTGPHIQKAASLFLGFGKLIRN